MRHCVFIFCSMILLAIVFAAPMLALAASVHGVCTLEPVNIAEVRPTVDGTVIRLSADPGTVEPGGDVRKGDLLAELDPRPFTIELERGKADLAHAQAELAASKKKLDLAEKKNFSK